MFTKNIKSIGIIALIVVIVMVLSAVIATSNDKKVSAEIQNSANETSAKIDALNKTIDELNKTIADLKKGLATAEELAAKQEAVIEALKNAGVEINNWNAATEALIEKKAELDKVIPTFAEELAEDEVSVVLVYDVDFADVVDDLYEAANEALYRATSVEAMDAIIAGLAADLRAIPTRVEKLHTALDAIEAGDVTVADGENMVLANRLLADTDDSVYEKDEKKALQDRFDDAFVAYYAAVANEYLTLVNALPTAVKATVADAEAIEEIEELLAGLYALAYNQTDDLLEAAAEAIEDLEEDLDDAEEAFYAVSNRVTVLEAAKVEADAFNKTLAGVKLDKIVASTTQLADIQALEAWVKTWAEAYDIVTKADNKDYVAANYALVDLDALEAIRNTYETKVADLKTAANAYMEAVKAIGETVTPDSKDALTAAQTAYEAMMDIAGIKATLADIDTMIETKADAKVSVASSAAAYETLNNNYKTILALIATVEKYVNETLRPEYCSLEGTKDHVCDSKKSCYVRPENYDVELIAQADVDVIDAAIETLICVYNQKETVIDATVLAEYKVIRFVVAKDAILAEIEASANTAAEKANYTRLINKAVMDGAFVEGVDEDGKETGVFADSVNAVYATIAAVRAELK